MTAETLTANKQAQCETAEKAGRVLTHPTLNFSSGDVVPESQIPVVNRLEQVRIESAWNTKFGRSVASVGCETFSDLRKFLSTGGGFTLRQHATEKQFEVIMARFSKRVYCECGLPYILHKDHVACEDFRCTAFRQTGNVNILRKVWPDRISHTRGE